MPPELKSAAGVLLLLAGGWGLYTQLGRPAPVDRDQQRALYEINRRNFAANCEGPDAGQGAVVRTFCFEAAAHLKQLPDCDERCQQAAAAFSASR